MKKMKIPCLFENVTPLDEDSRFAKCLIKVQHDGSNPNGSYFDKKDIESCANETLRYTPILGSVIYDEDSEEYKLNGHDMKYTIVETEDGYELKISHIERIFGFVSPDAEIYFEYNEEKDKNFLITEGYLWKNYMDELEDILDRQDGQTQVSMEISIDESFEREDGLLQIKKYKFEGITMLGVPEAMKGANLQLFAEDTLSELKLNMEELTRVYSLEKEAEDLKEKVNKDEKQEFGLSIQNITDQIVPKLNSRKINREDYWGDSYEMSEFYFMDILPDDKVAIVINSDFEQRQYFGVPYSVNEDVITLDFDNKKSYINEWREMKGDSEPKVYSIDNTEFKNHIINKFNSIDTHEGEVKELGELKTSYSELEQKLEQMNDYQELKEFRESYNQAEYEAEVKEISTKFNLDIEEYQELEEKAINKELSKEQYEKELYCLVGIKQMKNNAKFSKVDKSTSEVKVQSNNKISSIYGELGKKYLK